MTKFIVLEGPDNVGKSTLVRKISQTYKAKALNFQKTLPSGALLRMNTEKDFSILHTLFQYLDPEYVYILDRFVVSNLVYDKVLRGEDVSESEVFYKQFVADFQVHEIFLTRPHVQADFIDDRIRMTKDQFNAVIDEYEKYSNGTAKDLLFRNLLDEPVAEKPEIMYQIFQELDKFTARK
jgi:thymidylate kinase